MKTIDIPAKQPTKIIGRFSNSIASTYRFTAANASGTFAPSGTVEVRGSNWIFAKAPATQPLKAENTVTKSMWDTFYSVYVTPDHDVRITLEGGQMRGLIVIIALAIGIVALAASVMLIGLM